MDDFQPSQFDPDALKRRAIDPHIEVLMHQMTRMATDMDKLTTSISEMSRNMNRLVLAEERIATVTTSIERVNKRLDDGAARFSDLDVKVTTLVGQVNALRDNTGRHSVWLDRALWAAAGLGMMALVTKTGVLG